MQQTKIACVGKSVSSVDTSSAEKQLPPLSDDQALRVAEMALRVSAAYAVPYDIEWARHGNHIYLLQVFVIVLLSHVLFVSKFLFQARPITSFSSNCEGLWSLAGFDASSVLTLSMSAHAYAAFMARTMGRKIDSDLIRMMYCKSYINADLWRSFGKQLKKIRNGLSLADVVAQTEAIISERVARSIELRKTDQISGNDSVFARMQLLLKEQDEFNQVERVFFFIFLFSFFLWFSPPLLLEMRLSSRKSSVLSTSIGLTPIFIRRKTQPRFRSPLSSMASISKEKLPFPQTF